MFSTQTFVLLVFVGLSSAVPDIYWREFINGTIPEDAILAFTNDGVNGYIGSVPINEIDGLGVGTLYEGIQSITVEGYNSTSQEIQLFTKTYSIGILCSGYTLDHLPWITTNAASVADMEDQLLTGGFEPGDWNYLGRIKPGDRYYVGRVCINYHDFGNGLFYTDGEVASWSESSDFDVLTYKEAREFEKFDRFH